jgi:hypothetical protein
LDFVLELFASAFFEKIRSILEAITKKRPETVFFHTVSDLENTGFLELTSKPL